MPTEMGVTGLEPSHLSSASDEDLRQSIDASGAKSGALGAQVAPTGADLPRRIDTELKCRHRAWRVLPEAERVALLATACELISRAATSEEGRKLGAEPAEREVTP